MKNCLGHIKRKFPSPSHREFMLSYVASNNKIILFNLEKTPTLESVSQRMQFAENEAFLQHFKDKENKAL